MSMKKNRDEEVISAFDENGELVWLSEAAEQRLSWILAGVMVLATLPVFIIAFLM